MNVYDFDKTIYPRDSTAQFYLWCLRRFPAAWHTLPCTFWAFFCLGTGLKTKTACKQIFYRFLRYVPAAAAETFWREHLEEVESWYLAQKRQDDLVISASPEFLLRPVARALGFALLASPVERATGIYRGENCHGQEKVRRFRQAYGQTPIDGFWSDSRSDRPLAALAQRAFLVTRHGIVPWPQDL